MKALAAPRTLARAASVQRLTDPAATSVVRRGQVTPALGGDPLLELRDRQVRARHYAQVIGPVRFVSNMKAETCAGCRLLVEERSPSGSWVESEDARFALLFDRYANARQQAPDLVRAHAYRYGVDGEMYQVMRDTERGVEWEIFPAHLITVDVPRKDWVTVRLVPGGRLSDKTAFEVPKSNVVWIMNPHEDSPMYPTAPILSAIDDLRLYQKAHKRLESKIENLLAMDGLVWFPGEALTAADDRDDDEDGAGDSLAAQDSPLKKLYYDAARLRMSEDVRDIAQLVPTLLHWDHEYGPPQTVQLGDALDPRLLDVMRAALEAYARAENVPADLVMGGGGAGDVNHWSAWLNEESNFRIAIKPLMDRITHLDLTDSWLRPMLALSGIDAAMYRVGYDPTPVIARPDQSAMSLQLNRAGLLSNDATLKACNFNPDEDAMSDEADREWLLKVLSGGAAPEEGAPPGGPMPAQPGTLEKLPPPTANGQAPAPPAVASAGARQGYSEDQERDELGRFGPGGSSTTHDEPTVEGDPPGSTPDNPITVTSASEALELIEAGQYVQMDPDTLSVALDEMARIGNEAKALGEKAPLYDLCKISVPDTNLFCGESVVATRLEMPQLSGVPTPGTPADALPKNDKGEADLVPALREALGREGVKITDESVPAAFLKASQNELNGAKVGGMALSMDAGTMPPGSILVSSDNYVIDGHHRWAASVAQDYREDQSLGELKMDIVRIDMPIQQILDYANAFTAEMGIPPAQASVRVAAILGEVLAEYAGIYADTHTR